MAITATTNTTPMPTNPPTYTAQASQSSSDAIPDPTPMPFSPCTITPVSEDAPTTPAPVFTRGPFPSRTPSTLAPETVPYRTASHGSSKYLYAVPLHTLTRGPAPVDCPICNKRGATVCTTESGNFTHLWAALTCAGCCLGCIPYLIKSLKDVKHSCSHCGSLLAVWHRSGNGVDVVAYAMK